MRVLILGEQLRRPVPGGIGTYLRGLLQGLEEVGGVDVTVHTPTLPSPLVTRLWDWGVLRAPKGFDVVHAPSLATAASSSPMSVMVHDVAWRELPDAFPARGRRWHEAALRRARRRASLLLVPSERTASLLGGDPRVRVVEEGSDHVAPADEDGAARLLRSLGVSGPFVLTVSTLEPRKNLPRLVAAHRQASVGMPLVVVGPAGWGPALAPADGVVLAGFVDEGVKSALFGAARVVAYVPLLEGFGLPAVEAMRAGAVVVASPMPSTGGAALEVDPLSVESIAQGLRSAATDESVRARLVSAGSKRAAELTWAAAARRHVALWEELCR